MALSPAFSISTTSDPSQLSFLDQSTGSDGAVVGREILISQSSNALLGASPYSWPNFPASTSITINPLDKDYAITAVVNWVDVNGNVLYTANKIAVFTQYALLFLQELTQQQIANPEIMADLNFRQNKYDLFQEVQSAQNAINIGQSVSAAQSCVTRYQTLITNNQFYF